MSDVKLTISPTSLSSFKQSLQFSMQRVIAAADMGMEAAGESAFSAAQDRVPHVTGALASSARLTNQDSASQLKRTISYGDSTPNPKTGRPTSSYAIYVHEIYRETHPNSYKWLEYAIRQYGRENFLHDLAATLRASL